MAINQNLKLRHRSGADVARHILWSNQLARQKKSVSSVLSLLLSVVIAIAIISGRNPVISLIL